MMGFTNAAVNLFPRVRQDWRPLWRAVLPGRRRISAIAPWQPGPKARLEGRPTPRSGGTPNFLINN